MAQVSLCIAMTGRALQCRLVIGDDFFGCDGIQLPSFPSLPFCSVDSVDSNCHSCRVMTSTLWLFNIAMEAMARIDDYIE